MNNAITESERQSIIDYYLRYPNHTFKTIADRFGMVISTVYKIIINRPTPSISRRKRPDPVSLQGEGSYTYTCDKPECSACAFFR